jgi:hypothetical protein
MTTPTTKVKSQARSDQAKAILASLPRDPATGRIMKRGAAPAAGGQVSPPPPAGGPASRPPFAPGRGLRRWSRPRSG